MTIKDAQRQGLCAGCVWIIHGPGPIQCMGAQMSETICPGRTSREEMRPKEEA